MEIDRREALAALVGGALWPCADGLDALPGGPLLSAGYIATRARGSSARFWGRALRTNVDLAFDGGTPFRVASVSKMITAAGFMKQVERGRIDLDADISRYLGESLRHPAFPLIPITARMLLSHTSGLRNGEDFPVPFGAQLLPRLAAAADEPNYGGWFSPPERPPGHFGYSDTNFALIAQIVERVTGARFDRYMDEALFAPLGLEIGYNWSGVGQAKRDRAAAGCRFENGVWAAQVDAAPPPAPQVVFYRTDATRDAREETYRIGDNGFAFAPHGGLRLSLNDMSVLARMLAHGGRWRRARIGRDAIARMMRPVWSAESGAGATENGFYQRYGLGVQAPLGRPLSADVPGDAFFGAESAAWRGHCGDAYGWMTGLWWNVETRATLVWAINGMPETDRPRGRRSAMTAPEEALIDLALER